MKTTIKTSKLDVITSKQLCEVAFNEAKNELIKECPLSHIGLYEMIKVEFDYNCPNHSMVGRVLYVNPTLEWTVEKAKTVLKKYIEGFGIIYYLDNVGLEINIDKAPGYGIPTLNELFKDGTLLKPWMCLEVIHDCEEGMVMRFERMQEESNSYSTALKDSFGVKNDIYFYEKLKNNNIKRVTERNKVSKKVLESFKNHLFQNGMKAIQGEVGNKLDEIIVMAKLLGYKYHEEVYFTRFNNSYSIILKFNKDSVIGHETGYEITFNFRDEVISSMTLKRRYGYNEEHLLKNKMATTKETLEKLIEVLQ